MLSAIIEKTLVIHGPQTSFTMALKTVWAVTDTPAGNDFTAMRSADRGHIIVQ